MVNREVAPTPEGRQVSARMHIPAGPAERSRPGMSTDRITAAALQIVDTEGSQALTMRRLGQALDRKVMTLYRYIPSKDALLDGVVARVLTDLAINPAAADWRQELRDLATTFRGLVLAHPNAVPLLVTRPLTSPLGNGRQPPCGRWKLPRTAHPRRVQPCQRTARLPAVLRIPARTHPRRATGNHRQPRRGRRPAPARPAPPPPPRIPPDTRRGLRARQLRRSRPPPARRRTDDHRPAIPLPASTGPAT
jgi:AcrR family transcriptional regulator